MVLSFCSLMHLYTELVWRWTEVHRPSDILMIWLMITSWTLCGIKEFKTQNCIMFLVSNLYEFITCLILSVLEIVMNWKRINVDFNDWKYNSFQLKCHNANFDMQELNIWYFEVGRQNYNRGKIFKWFQDESSRAIFQWKNKHHNCYFLKFLKRLRKQRAMCFELQGEYVSWLKVKTFSVWHGYISRNVVFIS